MVYDGDVPEHWQRQAPKPTDYEVGKLVEMEALHDPDEYGRYGKSIYGDFKKPLPPESEQERWRRGEFSGEEKGRAILKVLEYLGGGEGGADPSSLVGPLGVPGAMGKVILNRGVRMPEGLRGWLGKRMDAPEQEIRQEIEYAASRIEGPWDIIGTGVTRDAYKAGDDVVAKLERREGSPGKVMELHQKIENTGPIRSNLLELEAGERLRPELERSGMSRVPDMYAYLPEENVLFQEYLPTSPIAGPEVLRMHPDLRDEMRRLGNIIPDLHRENMGRMNPWYGSGMPVSRAMVSKGPAKGERRLGVFDLGFGIKPEAMKEGGRIVRPSTEFWREAVGESGYSPERTYMEQGVYGVRLPLPSGIRRFLDDEMPLPTPWSSPR